MHLFTGRTTLSKFVIEHLGGDSEHAALAALLVDVAAAIKTISAISGKGALGGMYDNSGTENPQGDHQKKLDVIANAIFVEHCSFSSPVAGMVSAETEDPIYNSGDLLQGRYLLMFDPLEGSAQIELNVPLGTIFSIHEYRGQGKPETADFLQCGGRQVAAGYAIYGPATMLVLTAGKGTYGFTLDREIGNFVLTHPDMQIPADTTHFAINTSNERFWEPPILRYVAECKEGSTGIRGKDFNMRWNASTVADVHRILMQGGVFMDPRSTRDLDMPARLRLMYEASPMAFVVEQAGGCAITGRERILDVDPDTLHERVPVMLGSKHEIERIEQYHHEFDTGTDKPYQSPLFNTRSLYRVEN